MSRDSLAVSLAGLASLALAGVFAVNLLADKPAQPGGEPPLAVAQASRSESASKLPLGRVVLFNSGVGYFQREGDIDGDARIDLAFPVQDVNDLLKSLVVQDLGGGSISAVSLDSQAPVEKTLKSFAIDLSGNPSLAQLLDQARGEKVEVALQQSATTQPGTLTGSIVGIERQKQTAGKDAIAEVEQLNLWCAEGLRQVKLADLQRVRFLNPILDGEFKKALEAVTLGHDTQKKAVSFVFTGQGRRTVRVGYVVENPIWKTSYRLVLNKEGKPFLQGWAVVENTTDEDWNNVKMSLVSGRPVSFLMDLYQPLYVPRPVVEPELFASLRPPTYSGALGRTHKPMGPGGVPQPPTSDDASPPLLSVMPPNGQGIGGLGAVGGGIGGGLGALGGGLGALGGGLGALGGLGIGGGGLGNPYDTAAALRALERFRAEELNLKRGVAEAATATNLGNSFRYDIDQAISLARQKTSLLPLVNKPVEGERVSIYNEGVHAKFSLLGIRFKNTTGLELTQGPVTVFDGASYAGDARLPDLQPKEERLLSYAIDLGTEVQAVPESDNGRLTAIKIVKGVIHTTAKLKESKTYTLTNRSEQDRLVLIEHPYRPEFKLTSAEKPAETARDVYRFELKVPAGKTVKQTVAEERMLEESVGLTNFNDEQVRFFVQSAVSSPRVREALQTALEKRLRLAQTRLEFARVGRELTGIKSDQPRLLSNLEKVPGSDPLAKRILEKLNKQETEIEQYEEQVKKLKTQENQEHWEYEQYLAGLDVE